MFSFLKKWNFGKLSENKTNNSSLLIATFGVILEDALFWKRPWISLYFIFLFNLVFFVCVHQQIKILPFVFSFGATYVIIDAIESWLKYKHRTAWLKRLANNENSTRLRTTVDHFNNFIKKRFDEYVYLREKNQTKAFLLINIVLIVLFLVGMYINAYLLIYIIFMLVCFAQKIVPVIYKLGKKLQQNAESDVELEDLLPEVSEANIQLLSIELEQIDNRVSEDRQSLADWKPEDLNDVDDTSDSSDHSSSLVTNLSIEKHHSAEDELEESDSSEDEYIPLVKLKSQLQSTLEIQPSDTWGTSAYNAIRNITGAVTNIVYRPSEDKKRLLSSIDSSDGFEIIDENDLN